MGEGEPGESAADVGAAGEHRQFALVEIVRDEPRHQRRGVFRKFRRLYHRAVAGGEDARHRHEDHADREIPWGYDADDALGLKDDLGLRAEQAERKSRPPRSEEHTSELQSLIRISYAVFCL